MKYKILKTSTPKDIDVFFYSTDDKLIGEIEIEETQAKRLVSVLNRLSDTHIYLVRQEKIE